MEKISSMEKETYVAPACEVIELGIEDSILITGSTRATHDVFNEVDYSDKVIWK